MVARVRSPVWALALTTSVLAACAADTPSPAEAQASRVILDESFADDRDEWGGNFQRIEDGVYIWELPPGASDSRAPDPLIAIEDELVNVQVKSSFTATSMDYVGVECAYAAIGGSSRWYSLLLTTEGLIIRKRPLGSGIGEDLASNRSLVLTNEPTTMTVTCRAEESRYVLEVAVNDGAGLSVADDAADRFGAGAPGLVAQAESGSGSPKPRVEFTSFVVTVPSPTDD